VACKNISVIGVCQKTGFKCKTLYKLQALHFSKIPYTDNHTMFYTDTNNGDSINAFLQNNAGWRMDTEGKAVNNRHRYSNKNK
jgi:hypothetical protein